MLITTIIYIQCNDDIVFVFEHFRHGSRAPGFWIARPNEDGEYIDQFGVSWKLNGGLTKIGKRMEYMIGVRNRYKYKKLLSTIFDPKELLVVSSPLARTIASAEIQLQGMFPEFSGITLKEKEISNAVPPFPLSKAMKEEIKKLGRNPLPERMQIIPIHIFKQHEMDHILSSPRICPRLEKVKNKLRQKQSLKDLYKKINETYGKELMTYFKENSTDFLYDYYRVFFMADVFLADYLNDRNLTKLEELGIDLEVFKSFSFQMGHLYLFECECNEELAVFAISPTARKILKWMENRIQRDINNDTKCGRDEPKYVMYSGHDMTLAPLQLFFKNIFGTPIKYPQFGSTLYLELHRRDKPSTKAGKRTIEDYYVEYYLDGEMIIRLSFANFKKTINKKIWSDDRIEQYCQKTMESKNIIISIIIYLIIIMLVFITLFLLWSSCNCDKSKKKNIQNIRYHSLDR